MNASKAAKRVRRPGWHPYCDDCVTVEHETGEENCAICGIPKSIHDEIVLSLTITDKGYEIDPKHEFVLSGGGRAARHIG